MKKTIFIVSITLMSILIGCEKEPELKGTAGSLSWELTTEGILLIKGQGKMPDYDNVIGSSTYNPPPWIWLANNIKKVVIADGVTSIGNYAFNTCSLTDIDFPPSVNRIGNNAFNHCTSLRNITLPDHVTTIEKETFYDCYGLTNISIPNGITIIDDGAFFHCGNLTEFIITENVTTIGNHVFFACRKLKNINIPDNVKSIGESAFSCNYNLISVTIGNGITIIPSSAFRDNPDLTNVFIGNGISTIGDYAFSGCRNIKQMTIMSTVPPEHHEDDFKIETLYVPKESIDIYRNTTIWATICNNIEPI